MKHLNLTIIALFLAIASFAQVGPISGPSSLCVGQTGTYTDPTTGGTWTCASPILSIGITTGIATGISAGTTTITYTVGAYDTVYSVSVAPLPAPIGGPTSLCVGSSISATDTTPGGTWTITPMTHAVVDMSGLLTGVASGVSTLYYTSTYGCIVSETITVNPMPTPITGTLTVCAVSTTTLSSTTPGGVWVSTAPVVASVGSASGVVTGNAPGYTNINYVLPATGCQATSIVTVTPASPVYAVTGGGSYCSGGAGVPVGLANSIGASSYQLYLGITAVGAPVSGTGSAISFGPQTAAGVYTVVANPGTSCASAMSGSATVVVNPSPAAFTVTGGGSYCAGGTGLHVYLSATVTGISYQLFLGTIPVGPAIMGSGSIVDFGPLTAAGVYTVVAIDAITGCTAVMTGSATISIDPLPVVHNVIGGGAYCTGGTGVDVSIDGSDAGISYQLYYGGLMTGVPVPGTGSALDFGYQTAAGIYTVVATNTTTSCTSNMSGSATVVINPSPTIYTGAPVWACGGNVTVAATGAVTYSWSPATGLSCTTCSSITANPSATTVYTVTGTDGSGCTGTATVSINGNRISGYISYTGTASDSFKVWLIQFNPSDSSITAEDSMTTCMDSGIPYYEFDSKPSGNYLVKAQLYGTVPGTSGYIPTYGLSSAYWYSATTISHAAATDTQPITMIYGTVPAGPGFIAGYVISGAGKGTSADVPAAGMMIYLKNASGSLITYTITAADGTYSFSNLAYGSYMIYPESYKDYTTPSATITLAPGSDSANAINFKQHTTTHTITPYDNSKVHPVYTTVGINIFPNPASGTTIISWQNQSPCNATVVVTDMMGREVINTNLNINMPSGQAQLDLSALNDGMYIISIRSAGINFNRSLVKANN